LDVKFKEFVLSRIDELKGRRYTVEKPMSWTSHRNLKHKQVHSLSTPRTLQTQLGSLNMNHPLGYSLLVNVKNCMRRYYCYMVAHVRIMIFDLIYAWYQYVFVEYTRHWEPLIYLQVCIILRSNCICMRWSLSVWIHLFHKVLEARTDKKSKQKTMLRKKSVQTVQTDHGTSYVFLKLSLHVKYHHFHGRL
jgi:hypothetical protein